VSGDSATISTHVLDATAGAPATAVAVLLERGGAEGQWLAADQGTTDADGRLRFPGAVPPGQYRLTFVTSDYFAARGTASFYPEVTVTFTVTAGHYHVPLLLSPFAYSTYRGS
jgi:5-hydroxyisourate hydrolase